MADIYEEAAKCLVECIGKKCMTLKFPDDKIQELTKERNIFRDEYSPDALRKLPKDDKETLWKLFITSDGKKDNLDNVLENKTHDFGAITVYSASDYGLYRGKDGFWFTVEKGGMSDEQALPIGIKIRDEIVLCCEKIEERINGGQLSTVQDYEDLQEDLTDIIGQNLVKMAWLRKYFYINFPQYFVNWYKEDFLEEFLYGLGIIPTNKLYGKIGQLVMVKKCIDGLVSIFGTMEFMNGCFSLGFLKKFYILNTNAVEMETVAYMSQNGIVGLACDPKQNLGSFAELGKKYTKTLLKKKLKQSSFDILLPMIVLSSTNLRLPVPLLQ